MTPPPIPWAPMAWSLAMLLAWTGLAHCQDTDVLIARTLVSEEGWDGASTDVPGGWASLGAVIRWRAGEHHDGDLRAATRALSPRLHGDPCSVSRTWLCDLGGLERPDGLRATWDRPRAGGRSSRRDAWTAALVAARAILAGEYPDGCRETPHAWGSRADVRLRLAAGERWQDAGCPGRNRYGRRLVRR